MPIDGLSEKHFEIDEMKTIKEYAMEIIKIIQSKTLVPSAEERAAYNDLPEKKKLIINKVMSLRNEEPTLCSAEIDWTEFYKSYADNVFLKSTILTFESIIKHLENARVQHDYENYKLALKEFEYTASKKENDIRQESKYNALKVYL